MSPSLPRHLVGLAVIIATSATVAVSSSSHSSSTGGLSMVQRPTATSTSSCTSNLDCQLNGECNASTGVCLCRAGWTGNDCGQLDFLEAPTTHAFYRPQNASWGGSVVYEPSDSTWHLFYAEILGSCGLNAWQPNSAIYHAVSSTSSPLGPYVNETLLLTWFAHNPTASRHPDGTLLVWHIGNGLQQGTFDQSCTNGTTPPPPPPPPKKYHNGGGCLIANGTWPCWAGGPNKTPWNACPLVVGDCNDPTSEWSDESGAFTSYANTSASINIDCNHCTEGTVAKMFSAGSSGLQFNATSGQIMVSSCSAPSMCLTNGQVEGALAPCGGGTEPWLPVQVHLAPCTDPSTLGWTTSSSSASSAMAAVEGSDGALPPPPPLVSLTQYPAPPTDVNVMVSESGSVYGPWYQSGILQGNRSPFPYETDNPAPLVFANGSTWVMFRSWNPQGGQNTTTPIGIARSSETSWNSSYILPTHRDPCNYANGSAEQGCVYIPLEDPFMWLDEDSGTFHALFHNMGGCKEVGCHAFSEDGFLWYLASSDAYTTTVNFTDGSQITYARRERPHLVFNQRGEPAFLTNGVQETWSADHSYTLIQGLNVPWP